MRKNVMRLTLCAMLLAFCSSAEAQQTGKIWRIGLLVDTNSSRLDAFRQGLHELGYSENQNVSIEYRIAEGKPETLASLAGELVRLKVDLIVAAGGNATAAAKNATRTIPIVMAAAADPIGARLVDSLARPGGNITGLTTLSAELSGKRLELVKEILPGVSRVGVLWNPEERGSALSVREMEAASQALGLQLQSLQVKRVTDFDEAFSAITTKRAGALVVIRGAVTNTNRSRIIEFATKSRLPVMYSQSGIVEAGGLIFYGVNDHDLYRRAAIYVDKILKGAKPADLPVEQPKKFELVINVKTAQQIGLTIPPNVLTRADKVIR